MYKLFIGSAFGLLLFNSTAMAACSVPYPTFASGTTADASQVNANFAALVSCANSNAALAGYLSGLQLSAAGSSSTFGIATGVATDSTAAASMSLVTAYNKTTSSWAVGSGVGSLDTGSIANNTWYHVFLIERTDTGVVDVLVSLSATTPTLPTSYTLSRRIGSMKTDGSARWIAFSQFGDQFIWASNVASVIDVNYNSTTTQSAQTLNVPTGVRVVARIRGFFQGPTSAQTTLTLSSPSEVSLTTSNPSYPSTSYVDAGANGTNQGFTADVLTNTTAQVNVVANSSSGSNLVRMTAYGWYDARGKN